MVKNVKQQAFQVFDLLSENEQTLVFELIKSLAPDDIASADDIATHENAMVDYIRGETVSYEAVDWN
jgi:hypothetical protein